ncbi:hypothetical protein [Bordetella sp. LUAb4]|uniref:hypothetical protein n=1 Tax=Bordetella sp. LUAb4 TaxID=2843195 RepID=UPI001E34FBED|nr:hypothetical protein [Bordetella sp. LUAb4]
MTRVPEEVAAWGKSKWIMTLPAENRLGWIRQERDGEFDGKIACNEKDGNKFS